MQSYLNMIDEDRQKAASESLESDGPTSHTTMSSTKVATKPGTDVMAMDEDIHSKRRASPTELRPTPNEGSHPITTDSIEESKR